MTDLPAALERWVLLSGPTEVVTALRKRAEGGHHLDTGTLRVALTEPQRREVGLLLGTPWEISQRPINLSLLAARLADHGITTRDMVAAGGAGPIVVRREARAAARDDMLAARNRAARLLTDAGVPPSVAAGWSMEPAVTAVDVEALAQLVATVWAQLPGHGGRPVRLAQLAADVLHHAHALDATAPAGRAVARIAAAVHALPRPGRSGADWRAAWRSVGVACDTVSSRVLVLNLPLRGSSPAAAVCVNAMGEPVWLTQRMLDQDWTCTSDTVFVCENPTIVEAAADALGDACPPLVCTDGIAAIAATDLIAGLVAALCPIVARADFDEAGLVVVDQVRAVAPQLRPWRFDQATYGRLVPLSLVDSVTSATDLREAIRIGGAVHEERLLTLLLDDLRAESVSHPPSASVVIR